MTWLGTLENIFTCEGQPGHEIVLVFDAHFSNRSLYEQVEIPAHEHGNGQDFTAVWRSHSDLEAGLVRLVPEGLLTFLKEQG